MAEVIERAGTVPGVELRSVSYDSDGFAVPAILALPVREGPFPGVIIGQEAFGPTEHIEDVAANLAREGYVALSPDYYARTGGPQSKDDVATILPAIDRIVNPAVLHDYVNGMEYLERSGLAVPGRTGAIGFCTGATYSMILAIERPTLTCAVLFYVSQLIYDDLNERKPYHPVDRAGEIRCPTLVAFGDDDPVGPPELLARLEANLKGGGVPYELRMYAGAGHAFLNPDFPMHHESASRQAWPDALAFLRRRLQP